MKKLLEKIVSITLAVISTLFVVLILVVMFGGLKIEDLDNNLVHALMIGLSIVFLILTGLNIYTAFVDNERLSAVMLFKDKESATKATVSVLKKTAKRVAKQVPEAKIGKIQVFADENGNVKLKIDVKLKTDETMAVVTRVRAVLIEAFDDIFGIEFSAIDYRIVKSKNTFVPPVADVDAKVAELKASIVVNKPIEPIVKPVAQEAVAADAPIIEDSAPEKIIPSGDAFDGKTESVETPDEDTKDTVSAEASAEVEETESEKPTVVADNQVADTAESVDETEDND